VDDLDQLLGGIGLNRLGGAIGRNAIRPLMAPRAAVIR
jgi:hypothetical protein